MLFWVQNNKAWCLEQSNLSLWIYIAKHNIYWASHPALMGIMDDFMWTETELNRSTLISKMMHHEPLSSMPNITYHFCHYLLSHPLTETISQSVISLLSNVLNQGARERRERTSLETIFLSYQHERSNIQHNTSFVRKCNQAHFHSFAPLLPGVNLAHLANFYPHPFYDQHPSLGHLWGNKTMTSRVTIKLSIT